ncbi:CNNM domain-containing protein [Candidatus Mycoplasma mahonii]|uniref:CNNM domain-containing protein n=1 Tax=Candidatus Mycoplasma mahonii TaxID=3004105 RepID=UPI0026F23585|nr:hemolysin family protein [Candidatus Mycoplasma mahonii]WKX02710.1 hemolysin family protein [Candidatus Mycoplasma mahonii]
MPTGYLIGIIFLLIILIILSAIFSAAETAYSSVRDLEIEKNFLKNKKSAKLIKKHHKSFGWTLATILISNNLVNIFATSAVTFFISQLIFSSGATTILATVVMTPLIVIFGEIMPKLFAKKYPYKYLTKVVYLMEILNWLFLPLTFFIRRFTLKTKLTNTENDLKLYIDIASKEGVLEKKEATLATNALDLDSTKISNIYTPIKNVSTINEKDSRSQALDIFKRTGHSRLPVISNGEISGVLLLKNVIFSDEKNIVNLFISVPKLSHNSVATKALEEMRMNSSHMILIENNKRKIVGILTLEDIIEELFGEIYDEHDKQILFNQISLHKFIATEKTMISDVEKNLGIVLNKNDNDLTVKKWISQKINRNFKKNIVYTYKGIIKFKIIENKKNGSTKIEVTQK